MSLAKLPAYWAYDDCEGCAHAYYFAPESRSRPPYREQRHATAILDIAEDGTLAGIELIELDERGLPPPPKGTPLPNEKPTDRVIP